MHVRVSRPRARARSRVPDVYVHHERTSARMCVHDAFSALLVTNATCVRIAWFPQTHVCRSILHFFPRPSHLAVSTKLHAGLVVAEPPFASTPPLAVHGRLIPFTRTDSNVTTTLHAHSLTLALFVAPAGSADGLSLINTLFRLSLSCFNWHARVACVAEMSVQVSNLTYASETRPGARDPRRNVIRCWQREREEGREAERRKKDAVFPSSVVSSPFKAERIF